VDAYLQGSRVTFFSPAGASTAEASQPGNTPGSYPGGQRDDKRRIFFVVIDDTPIPHSDDSRPATAIADCPIGRCRPQRRES
jgi:hypothetical protein